MKSAAPNVQKGGSASRCHKSVYGGHTFTVLAENNSPTNIYIQSATWDNKPYNKTRTSRRNNSSAGGTLRNSSWGQSPTPPGPAPPTSRPPATLPARYYGPRSHAVRRQTHRPDAPNPHRLRVPTTTIGDFIADPNMLDGADECRRQYPCRYERRSRMRPPLPSIPANATPRTSPTRFPVPAGKAVYRSPALRRGLRRSAEHARRKHRYQRSSRFLTRTSTSTRSRAARTRRSSRNSTNVTAGQRRETSRFVSPPRRTAPTRTPKSARSRFMPAN